MKNFCFLLGFVLLAAFYSCSEDDGTQGNPPVALEVSSDEVVLDGGGGSDYVDVKGDWWIFCIEVDGESLYMPTDEERETMAATGAFEKELGWLTIKCEKKRISFTANRNMSGIRTFTLTVSDGSDVKTISGTQDVSLVGDWEYRISLQPTEFVFEALGGKQVCTTSGNGGWWISDIIVGDEIYPTSLEEVTMCADEHAFNKTIDWLTIQRDGDKLYVTAAPNYTGVERKFEVLLQYGDWFSHLYGTQKTE